MNKIPIIRPIAFVLIFVLAACTRPASLPSKKEPLIPSLTVTGTPVAATVSPDQGTEDTENPILVNTATALPSPENNVSPQAAVIPVTQIPLVGPASSREAEISGLAWYGDELLLLPQYPYHFPLKAAGSVFSLQKSEILDYIQGKTSQPLKPVQIPFIAPDLDKTIKGFEGFEAIAVDGDRVYLTIEASPGGMMGYLIAGQISPGLSQIQLDTSRLTPIPPQTALPNFSDEALLVFGSRLVSIYEISGSPFNPKPIAHLFDFSLQLQDTLAFPDIPYRISDATPPDEYGRFWTINFTSLGAEMTPSASDPLTKLFQEVLSQFKPVNRLVELQFSEAGIVPSDNPPIQLEANRGLLDYNWEGIARLDGVGFLLATDHDPETILGFVPNP